MYTYFRFSPIFRCLPTWLCVWECPCTATRYRDVAIQGRAIRSSTSYRRYVRCYPSLGHLQYPALRHIVYTLLCGGLLLLPPTPTQAQSVDGFWQQLKQRQQTGDYFRLRGSASADWRFNAIRGLPARADGLALRAQLNLMMDVMGVKIPLSAAFSDGNLTYRLPAYAFYGASPSYKWATLLLGDRSLNFSPYSLHQQNFKGIGLELKPGHWYLAAMVGRLRRARAEDAEAIQDVEGAYRRMGWGIKGGYDDGKNRLMLHLFKAYDQPESLTWPDTHQLRPQENLVLGIQGHRSLGEKLSLEGEVARSALSRDVESPLATENTRAWTTLGLMPIRNSTGYHHAVRTKMVFKPTLGTFSLNYERIAPGYRTLGALLFNNDLESITLGVQLPLWGQKINLSWQGGLQRSGLEQVVQQNKRWVNALSLDARLSERLQLNGAYSNFSQTSRQQLSRIPIIQVDSIVWVQTQQSFQLGSLLTAGQQQQASFGASCSWQRARTLQNEEQLSDQDSRFMTAMLTHSYAHPQAHWQYEVSAVYNRTLTGAQEVWMAGPGAHFSKKIGKEQINLGLGGSWQYVHDALNNNSSITELHTDASYKIGKKQTLSLRLSWVRAGGASSAAYFQDWNGALRYRYQFK